ncbi:hypothetical protein SteCoe_34542 [Stentor coeruleus]|uniref:Uncharacterized protein n=1 Tax=Stentor coeruleus TaxID=5963 RepID=A0A1R2AUB1_9CILI|nr:hypothetical protein SteCoe_34542 [Stentor coeruleus]
MECFLCFFFVADSCILCALSVGPDSFLRRFWTGVWALVNICLFLNDSFNFWTASEFLSTLIFSKLTWYIFWFTHITIPIFITGSIFNPIYIDRNNSGFLMFFTIQCFSMLYTYSFYNGGYETLIFISPLLYGLVLTLIYPIFLKDFYLLIGIWFICLGLDTFSSLISLWHIVHLFFVYIVIPLIEYPLILGLLSGFANGTESLINKIEKDHYTIHTRGKSKKQIICFIVQELLHVMLLGGSLIGVYFSESIIIYFHGYCPIFISILTMIGYSYPLALGLAYPKRVFNNALPEKTLIFLNAVPIATVLIFIKVIFFK